MNRRFLRLWLCALTVLTLASCTVRQAEYEYPADASLALSGFTNPKYSWELLAGCLPDQCKVVDPKVISNLNQLLAQEMLERKQEFISPTVTQQCREIVLRENGDMARDPALEYWIKVGRCVPAEYLLLSQVLDFQERVGGEWSAQSPARVVMDFYLIDARNGELIRRYHYEETQQPLTENVLDFDKFIDRGGKWVTAYKLSREAIRQALDEFGF